MFQGSLVALVTPMAQDGQIDYTSLDRLVEWHLASGTQGLVIGGTTGESATLRPVEKVALVAAVLKCVRGRIPVIAGSGTHATDETLQLTRRMAELGVDGCLLVAPYYNKPGPEGQFRHFEVVARSVSVPILLYNVPSRTACDLLPETVARLSRVPGIVGIKEAIPGVERLRELRKVCRPDFGYWSGDDGTALDFIEAGGAGVISVTANVVPDRMAQWVGHALRGEWSEAREMQESLLPLHEVLFVESNPVPVKWALHEMGWIPGGIRLPLVTLSEGSRERVRTTLERLAIGRAGSSTGR
jgi:4-hydroxy-tetrahydrodipicolinate synthase